MPDADFGTSIWDEFDEALECAREELSRARENKQVSDHTDEPLREIYSVALQEVEAAIDDLDSVYNVTDDILEETEKVASQASLLGEVTAAYRNYHESVIERRVAIAGEWFDELNATLDETRSTVDFERATLSKQRQVLEKFVETDRYGQLLSSDRVSLEAFEGEVESFDAAVRDEMNPKTYVGICETVLESIKDLYTRDLSSLTDKDIETPAISVADRLNQAPDIDPIVDRCDSDEVTEEDAAEIAKAVQVYTEVANSTGRQQARYHLGSDLISVIETSPLFEYGNTAELRTHLSTLDVEKIESAISTVIEREVTTPEDERFKQLLAEHDGSVRQTARALDTPTEEVFELLQELYESGDLTDLEARFE